jgi:transposase
MTFTRAITLLDRLPGVNQQGAERLVAEWGIDMERFGTASRLAAWSGVAPGNNDSAGIQRSGKTRKGKRALRTGLIQIAHAATHSGDVRVSLLASPRGSSWQEAGHSGRRTRDRGECLSHARA